MIVHLLYQHLDATALRAFMQPQGAVTVQMHMVQILLQFHPTVALDDSVLAVMGNMGVNRAHR
jgi:hypothetical protein